MRDEILLRCREDGIWEKYKEPFATIHCPTEENFRYLKEAVDFYKQHLKEKEPLTLEELTDMKGQAIFCTPLNDWAKVTCYGLVYFGSTKYTNWTEVNQGYGKTWLAYRSKPIEG